MSNTESLKLALSRLGFRYEPYYRTLSGRRVNQPQYIRSGESASVKDEDDVRWLFPIRINEMIDTLEYFGAPVRIVYDNRVWTVTTGGHLTDDPELGIALGLMVARELPPIEDRPLVVPIRRVSWAFHEVERGCRVGHVCGGSATVLYEIAPGEIRGYGAKVADLRPLHSSEEAK